MSNLLVDIYEGSGPIDLDAMYAGGVIGFMLRLNAVIPYGLRMDTSFKNYWTQIRADGRFVCAPYFVPNPWASVDYHSKFLLANIPTNAGCVLNDWEISRQTGWSPSAQALFISKLVAVQRQYWNEVPYTGEWFLPNSSAWPKEDMWWWSEYPNALCPAPVQTWTWEQLHTVLQSFPQALNASKCPGPIGFWQCVGSTSATATRPVGGLILPGSTKVLDVSVTDMSVQQVAALFKQTITQQPPQPPVQTETLEQLTADVVDIKARLAKAGL